MALMAQVVDDTLVTQTQSSEKPNTGTSSSTLDKDAFLQLLAAEMKYQDPLAPTSNTEYISQFATFSQVESLGNMEASMELGNAYNLVGKQVIMKVSSASTGETSYKEGKVDYVYIENNKAYLSIDGSLYAASDLDTVVDDTYLDAYTKVNDWVASLSKLPRASLLTLSDVEDVQKLVDIYEDMTDYEKTFISTDVKTYYDEAVEAMKKLLAEKEASSESGENTEETETQE